MVPALVMAVVLPTCSLRSTDGPLGGAGTVPIAPTSTAAGEVGTADTASNALPIATPPPPLTWAPCRNGFECATLDAPLDYRAPEAERVSIAVVRRPATVVADRLGTVVVNPGGPGSSGVTFLRGAGDRFANLNRRFDLVSFDPRGVGQSTPALSCYDEGLDDRIDVLGPGGLTTEAFLSRLAKERDRCVARNAAVLGFVGTNNVARDVDRLRVALGEGKLNFLGFSYGSRIGAVYDELFPDRVRALALDGADDPDPRISRGVGEQYEAFEAAFRRLIACAAGTGVSCPPGVTSADVEGLFRAVERSLREEGPLRTTLGTRRLTLGELYYAVIGSLYDPSSWSRLIDALTAAAVPARGDGTLLQQMTDAFLDRRPDGSYTNATVANVAVNCADDTERPAAADRPAEPEGSDAVRRGRELALRLPLLGPLAATAYTDCVRWPAAVDPVLPITGRGATPVLVIGTRYDTATPYAWAAELARALATATVLTYEGDGHTAYRSSSCVRSVVDAYFVAVRLPDLSVCA